jgi:transposase-like protein
LKSIIFAQKKLMIHTTDILCSSCGGNNLQKNGMSPNGTQRWHCKECKRYFQLTYRYNAYIYGIKDKVIAMTLNSSGVRDIGRVLKINKNTVVAILKKNSKNQPLLLNS